MTHKALKTSAALLLLTPVLALAAVPATMSFSARIADSGQPVTGTQSFTFVLWNDPTAGTAVWSEGPRSIPVNDGVVATALGDVANGGTALPAFDGPLWLEVTMGSAVFPRIALQTVPYAFVAASVANPLMFTTAFTSVTVAAATCDHLVDGASCPAGYQAVGVGCSTFNVNGVVTNQWVNITLNAGRCGFCNNGATSFTASIYTFCARLP